LKASRLAVAIAVLLAGGCKFDPKVAVGRIVCTSNDQCPSGQSCQPWLTTEKRCCARANCDDLRNMTPSPSRYRLEAAFSTVPAAPAGTRYRLTNDGFERVDRACNDRYCLTGAITP
jgi:hypothetical protein